MTLRFPLDLPYPFFYLIDHFSGGFPDSVHGIPEFFHILITAPAGNIRERIIRGIQTKVLADRISYAFRFNLPCHLILFLPQFFHKIPVM